MDFEQIHVGLGFFDGVSYQDDICHSPVITGHFRVEVIREGKVILDEFLNGVTDAGLNALLGIMFHGDTQTTSWYALLISATSYTGLASGDLSSSHTGWSEATAYSETTRPQWTCGAAAAKSITNTSTMTFTISVDGTVVKGIGIIGNNTKGGTTGLLWSTGLFASDQTFLNGDQVKVTYTVNITAP